MDYLKGGAQGHGDHEQSANHEAMFYGEVRERQIGLTANQESSEMRHVGSAPTFPAILEREPLGLRRRLETE